MNCEGPTLTTSTYMRWKPSLSVNATRNIGPKWPRRLACFASMVNKLVACFASSSERQKAAILQSHLAACRGRIITAYFPVNCVLHISIKYNETDFYAHAQIVDTRRSSPIFQAPGYEARWATFLLSCTNGRRRGSFHLVGTPFLAL